MRTELFEEGCVVYHQRKESTNKKYFIVILNTPNSVIFYDLALQIFRNFTYYGTNNFKKL